VKDKKDGPRSAPSAAPRKRVGARGAKREKRVLVVDVGGTHVKMLATGETLPRQFDSGPALTAAAMVKRVKRLASDWRYDAVSLGFPGPMLHKRPVSDPPNLGAGWVGFDYAKAFGCPVRMINDAAMQALGSYHGGKMLFLGLGTGLGTAMIVDGVVEPMELGHLPYRKSTYEDYVGARAVERYGKRKWRRLVADVVERLTAALEPDDVVLGGGNVKLLKTLPARCRAGDNANAFAGGMRLWESTISAPEAEAGGKNESTLAVRDTAVVVANPEQRAAKKLPPAKKAAVGKKRPAAKKTTRTRKP